MAKYEKEVKILNVDVSDIKEKLINIDAKFIGEKNQKIYVYDIPTIYYRFLEIRELIRSNNLLCVETNVNKLKILAQEVDDLLSDEESKTIMDKYNITCLKDLPYGDLNKLIMIIEDKDFEDILSRFKINPNKWIRLRTDGKTTTLTTKHVFEKANSKNIQDVIESEINVSSFEESNILLNSIGIYRRSFQEKLRYSYTYKNAEIEIDIWPFLNPYVEIECDDESVIEEIIHKLGVEKENVVSKNTEQLYKSIGINIHEISELRFNDIGDGLN